MSKLPARRHVLWLTGLSLAILSAALIFSLSAQSKLPQVQLLSRPLRIPVRVRDRVASWIPLSRSWNWARSLILGRLKPVNFDSEIFSLKDGINRLPEESVLGEPVFSDTSTRVWFLGAPKLKELRAQLNRSSSVRGVVGSRVSTADGIAATLFTGQTTIVEGSTNQVGLETQFYVAVHPAKLDLLVSALFSEIVTNKHDQLETTTSIVTNLDIAARLQVPRGQGVVLVTRSGTNSTARSAGLLLETR